MTVGRLVEGAAGWLRVSGHQQKLTAGVSINVDAMHGVLLR